MKYLDRYLEDVKYHLYGKDKNDIIKELKSDILNRLDENYTEEDLIAVLEDLGAPWEVASSYNYDNNGLTITKENFNNYLKLLKLLFVIGLIVSCVAALDNFIDFNRFTLSFEIASVFTFIFDMLINTFNFTVISIGILTIIFYYIEKYDKEAKEYNKYIFPFLNPDTKVTKENKWSIKNLKSKRYNLIDYVAESICLIFFTGIFLVFLDRQIWPTEYQFFHVEYLNTFMGLIVLSIIIELVVNSYRFFVGENNLIYVILNILRNCYGIWASAFILLYQKMFYLPEVVIETSTLNNNIFYLVFFINVIIAISSISMSIYRYIKLK